LGRKKSGDERFDEVAGEIVNFAGESSGSFREAFIVMAVTAGVLYGGYYAAKQVKKQIEKRHRKDTLESR
jgi:hypothetical protein